MGEGGSNDVGKTQLVSVFYRNSNGVVALGMVGARELRKPKTMTSARLTLAVSDTIFECYVALIESREGVS